MGGCSTIEEKKKRSMLRGLEREGDAKIMLTLFSLAPTVTVVSVSPCTLRRTQVLRADPSSSLRLSAVSRFFSLDYYCESSLASTRVVPSDVPFEKYIFIVFQKRVCEVH